MVELRLPKEKYNKPTAKDKGERQAGISLARKGGQWLETKATVVEKGMHARCGRALVSHSTK